MGTIDASRTVEIEAPLERVYEIAADVGTADRWQKQTLSVEVLETDAEGRATLCEYLADAKVRNVKSLLRFSYDPPGRISWVQEKGDVKSLRGSWTFEQIDDGRTKATYSLSADPGRVLGLLLRGPVRDVVTNLVIGDAPSGLKQAAEAG